MLEQYKNSVNALGAAFSGLQPFCAEWELDDCAAAMQRIRDGKPAEAKGETSTVVMVSDITGLFITLSDTIELGNLGVDTISPVMKELILKLHELNMHIDNMDTLVLFQKKMEDMKSSECLSKSDASDLKNILNLAQVSFKSCIGKLK